jgi:ParB family chromosome partitioning protein
VDVFFRESTPTITLEPDHGSTGHERDEHDEHDEHDGHHQGDGGHHDQTHDHADPDEHDGHHQGDDDSGHAKPAGQGAVDDSESARESENFRANPHGDLAPVPGATFAVLPIASIREIGVLQPVVVRPIPATDPDGPQESPAEGADHKPSGPQFELIMGERRLRASQLAGQDSIPAIVKETADDDLLRDALLENLHRSQLNPLEEAAAYQQLLDDFGCSHEELAARIGRSRPQISNTLRLLRLPPLVARRLAAGVLSAGHARALLGLDDGAAMERLAQRIVAEGLSVRSVEEIVAMGGDDPAAVPKSRRPRAGNRHPQLDDLASRLSDRYDTRVTIALGQRKGKLTVEFASVEDLNRIVALMDRI